MRPRYLEIENLQSFTELQAIDFDKLGETGLFGIFGPTGSGKSSILDAITLALYGNVQRASRGTQGIINTSRNDLKVSFTFDLTKDNVRKTYRIERVYKRKKDSDSSVEAKLSRLFEVTDLGESIIADKLSEVNSNIIELIGLQFDDFTRSVVLPQNKFQEFLLSQKAEKTKMLERIFYLEEYGKLLSEKVNRRLSSVRYKYTNLEGAISTIGEASPEALIKADHNMKEALLLKQELDEEYKTVELKYQNTKILWELSKELQEVTEKESKHNENMEAIKSKEAICSKAIRANSLLPLVALYKTTQERLKEIIANIEASNINLDKLKKDLAVAEDEYSLSNSRLKQELPKLIERKTKLADLLVISKEVSEIENKLKSLRENYQSVRKELLGIENEVSKQKQQLDKANKEIADNKHRAETLKVSSEFKKAVQKAISMADELKKSEADERALKQKYIAHQEAVEELNMMLQKTANNINQVNDRVEQLNIMQKKHTDSKPISRNALIANESSYYKLNQTTDKLIQMQAKLNSTKSKKTETEAQINKLCANRGKLKEDLHKMQVRHAENAQLLISLNLEKEKNYAYEMAHSLTEGQPCPVCGSCAHPKPAEAKDDVLIEELLQNIKHKEQYKAKLEADIKKLENEIVKNDTIIDSLNEGLKQLAEELNNLNSEYKSLMAELPTDLKDKTEEDLCIALNNMKNKNSELLKELELWERREEEISEQLKLEADKLNSIKLQESSQNAQLKVNAENMENLKKELDKAVENLKIRETAYDKYLVEAKLNDPLAEWDKIEQNERLIEQILLENDLKQAEEAEIRKVLEQLAEQKSTAMSKASDVEAEGRGLSEQKAEKEGKVKQILGEKSLQEEILLAETSIKDIEEKEQKAYEALNSIKGLYNDEETNNKNLRGLQEIYKEKLEAERLRLEKELKDKEFCDTKGVEAAIIPEDKLEVMKQEIAYFEEVKNNLAIQKSILQDKLKDRNVSEAEWLQIKTKYESMQQEKEKCISDYENSKSMYNIIKVNYEKWIILDKELRKVRKKKELLEQIQKLLKGNGFIEYISEERLRYIAKEASETLGVLTKYKYALELDTENGFMIRDNANGGVLRMVSSLSGGETFLTSLSLALALSSQLQLKGQSPLEFFFLDEGFGTLDNELLDVVMDSLERLSSNKRVIGLISHVPELKNRMTRRLIVDAPVCEGRGSKVHIEKA